MNNQNLIQLVSQNPVLQDTTRYVFDQSSQRYTTDEFLRLHSDIVQDYLECLNGQELSSTIYVSPIKTELVPLSVKNQLNKVQKDHLRESVRRLHQLGIVHMDLHVGNFMFPPSYLTNPVEALPVIIDWDNALVIDPGTSKGRMLISKDLSRLENEFNEIRDKEEQYSSQLRRRREFQSRLEEQSSPGRGPSGFPGGSLLGALNACGGGGPCQEGESNGVSRFEALLSTAEPQSYGQGMSSVFLVNRESQRSRSRSRERGEGRGMGGQSNSSVQENEFVIPKIKRKSYE
jgi:hypothetical protein